jgi:hypothetical protein
MFEASDHQTNERILEEPSNAVTLSELTAYNVRATDLNAISIEILQSIFQILINQRTLWEKLFPKKYVSDTHSTYGSYSNLFERTFHTGDLQIEACSHMEATILATLLEFIIEYICTHARAHIGIDGQLFRQYVTDYTVKIKDNYKHELNFDRLFEAHDNYIITEYLNTRMTFKSIGVTYNDFIKDKDFIPYSTPPEYNKILQELRLLLCDRDGIITLESLARYFNFIIRNKTVTWNR